MNLSSQATAVDFTVNDESTDDEVEGVDLSSSACKKAYEGLDRPKWMLMSMCIGLCSSDGRRMGDMEAPPYKEMKYRKLIVPTSAQLRKEVSRRCEMTGDDEPKCRYWNLEKLTKWLKDHPITCLIDREYSIFSWRRRGCMEFLPVLLRPRR